MKITQNFVYVQVVDKCQTLSPVLTAVGQKAHIVTLLSDTRNGVKWLALFVHIAYRPMRTILVQEAFKYILAFS